MFVCHEPRGKDKGSLVCSRMRQRQARIIRGHSLDIDDVDVDGARTPHLMAHASQARLEFVDAIKKIQGSKRNCSQSNAIPIIRLGILTRPQYRTGTYQRGNSGDINVVPLGDFLDGPLQSDGYIPQVSTKG